MGLFKKERLPTALGATAPVSTPQHTVMVVDDEVGNLRVLHAMLSDRFRVIQASDGRQALDLLRALPPEQAPCVVLSDQRMPRMTGIELFEQVRELLPRSVRIIITGFVDVGAIVDAINRAGIYKFIVKPFDRHELLLTVERAIEAYQMRVQLDEYILQLEAKVKARTRELEEKNQALQQAYAELERASLTDPLTGLGNRRFLARIAGSSAEAERRRSTGARLAYLLIDLDHFKSVNDEHGHAAGDAVLGAMGKILSAHCRANDTAIRWGGEEFLLRVWVDGAEQALACAERLLDAVAAHRFDLGDGRSLQRTCSIGIALDPFDPAIPGRLHWERVLAVADAALYMAKRSGRNDAVYLGCSAPLPGDFERQLADAPEALVSAGVLHKRAVRTRPDA